MISVATSEANSRAGQAENSQLQAVISAAGNPRLEESLFLANRIARSASPRQNVLYETAIVFALQKLRLL